MSSVRSVLDQYDAVIAVLDSMASERGDTGSKCRGLLTQLNKGCTVLGLKITVSVFCRLLSTAEPLTSSRISNYQRYDRGSSGLV